MKNNQKQLVLYTIGIVCSPKTFYHVIYDIFGKICFMLPHQYYFKIGCIEFVCINRFDHVLGKYFDCWDIISNLFSTYYHLEHIDSILYYLNKKSGQRVKVQHLIDFFDGGKCFTEEDIKLLLNY